MTSFDVDPEDRFGDHYDHVSWGSVSDEDDDNNFSRSRPAEDGDGGSDEGQPDWGDEKLEKPVRNTGHLI
jgi:hypothetical protein